MIFGFILSVTMAAALLVYLVIATSPPERQCGTCVASFTIKPPYIGSSLGLEHGRGRMTEHNLGHHSGPQGRSSKHSRFNPGTASRTRRQTR